jgi:hypothetical protein
MTQTPRSAYPELGPRCTVCDILTDDLVMRKCRRCRTPSLFDDPVPSRRRDFDGKTYDEERDGERLGRDLVIVREMLLARRGEWVTKLDLCAATRKDWASTSARLRDLRKAKFGGFEIERRSIGDGMFEYRIPHEEMTWGNHDRRAVREFVRVWEYDVERYKHEGWTTDGSWYLSQGRRWCWFIREVPGPQAPRVRRDGQDGDGA